METAQYVHPTLAAVIANGADRFAAMLDAAIARSGNSSRSQGLIEVKPASGRRFNAAHSVPFPRRLVPCTCERRVYGSPIGSMFGSVGSGPPLRCPPPCCASDVPL